MRQATRNERLARLAGVRPMDLRLRDAEPLGVLHSVFAQGTGELYDMHHPCEMGIVLQGRFRRFDRENEVVLTRGMVWWHGPWEPHGWRAESRSAALVFLGLPAVFYPYAALALPPFLPFVRPSLRAHLQPSGRRAREAIIRKGFDLQAEIQSRRSGWQTAASLAWMMLIVDLLRTAPEASLQHASADTDAGRVLPALEYVHAHLGEKMTLQEAAARARMGRTRFAQAFKAMMGIPFAAYVTGCRLEGARRDLLHTEDKLLVIAQRWGFTDASHLCRQYKERFGHSPRQQA